MKTMKQALCALLALSLLLCLSACSSEPKTVSSDQLIAAYEQAGYEVFHKEYTDQDSGNVNVNGVCSVSVTCPDTGDAVYFEFFETSADAENYAGQREWNVVLWLYSLVSGHSTWVHTKTYGVIEYEYTDKEMLQPFEDLISQ